MKILIVDDSDVNRKYLRVLLTQEGHMVFEGNDGIEALHILEREQIDAVISDILMPRMDGYRLCYEIHKNPKLNSIPFIAYTATYTSPKDEQVALGFGADKFVVKPALPEVIIKSLHEAVATRGSRPKQLRELDELSAMKEYSEALVRKLEETNSELSQANRTLNERVASAEFNAEVNTALTHKGTLREILQSCTQAMVTHLDAAIARIWTLNTTTDVLELQASAGIYTHIDGGHAGIPVGQFTIGLIASKRKPHLTNNVIGDARVHDQEWATREGMVAFAGYPLVLEDRLVGVIAMFARKPLGQNTLAAMESIAKAVAGAIERKTMEDELKGSEERFREIAENIRDIFYISGPRGFPFHYVSSAYEQISGRTCESVYRDPQAWLEDVHPEDRARVENAYRSNTENLDEEFRIVRPDGALRWLRSRAYPVKDASGAVLRIVGIAEDITESKRSEEMQKARQRELQTLYDLSRNTLNTLDLQQVLEDFLDKAFTVGAYDIGVIRLLDPKTRSLNAAATKGYSNSGNIEYATIDLTQQSVGVNLRRALSSRKIVLAENIPESQGWGSFKKERVLTAVMVPIYTDEQILGIIQLGSRTRRIIEPAESSLLEALACHAALAIQKAELYEQTQHNLERIRALHEIDLAITSSLDLGPRLEVLLEKIELFVPIAAASTVNLLNLETGELDPFACRGMNAEEWRTRQRHHPSSWAKRVVEKRAPIAVLDIQSIPDENNPEIYRNLGFSSHIGVPLIAQGETLGVLGLYTKEKHDFDDDEIDFLETLASQAAVAIQNSQLYESAKRQREELAERERIQRILKELNQDITKMDADTLLKKLTRTICEVFKVDVSDVRFLAGEKWSNITVASQNHIQRFSEGRFHGGATEWVIKNRKPIAIEDYREREDFTPGRVATMFGTRGFLAAPLLSKSGEVMAVIRAMSKAPRTFTAQEIDLFEQMASGAAIAIESSRLYADLQTSNKVKSEFLSIISHELRTPLNIIMGYAGLEKDDCASEANDQHRQAVQKIDTQAKALLGKINSIMEATQIESGSIGVTKQPVSISGIFQELQAVYGSSPRKELTMIWRAPDNIPPLITDYEKLQRILKNLIDNAIKFTEHGAVTISAQLAHDNESSVEREESGSERFALNAMPFMEFKVSDTGIGITQEQLPFIFELFRQADSSTTRAYEGTGLGLYIAKKYAELLAGEIVVESELGKGSTFTLTLPVSEADRLGYPCRRHE